MKKYIVLISLALMTITCAVLEGLMELSPRFIQVNGLLTLFSAVIFISWVVAVPAGGMEEE